MAKFSLEEISKGLPGWLPKHQRKCHHCGKVMRPHIEWRDAGPDEPGYIRHVKPVVPTRVAWYGYGPENLFCTLTCGYFWAVRTIRVQSR